MARHEGVGASVGLPVGTPLSHPTALLVLFTPVQCTQLRVSDCNVYQAATATLWLDMKTDAELLCPPPHDQCCFISFTLLISNDAHCCLLQSALCISALDGPQLVAAAMIQQARVLLHASRTSCLCMCMLEGLLTKVVKLTVHV